MRKDEFTLQTFHRLINDLVSLAAIPPAAISELQGVAWMHAETDLIPKLKTVVGEFPKDLDLGEL